MDSETGETICFLDEVLGSFSKREKVDIRVDDFLMTPKRLLRKFMSRSTQTESIPSRSCYVQAECYKQSASTQVNPLVSSKLTQTGAFCEETGQLVKSFHGDWNKNIEVLWQEMNSKIIGFERRLDHVYRNIHSTSALVRKSSADRLHSGILLSFRFLLLEELESRYKIELKQIEGKYELHAKYLSSFRTESTISLISLSANSFLPIQLSVDSLLEQCKAILDE